MAYEYTNESVTSNPPITQSWWEVRDSAGNLIAELNGVGPIDFVFAFPYLDTFRVNLRVRDSLLNEDTETKEYIYDHFPSCVPGGGGGGPSVPTLAERYDEGPGGDVRVTGITSEYEGYCDCEKEIKVTKVRHVTLNEFTEEDLNFTIALRQKIQEMETREKEIEEKAKELIELVKDPDEDIKPKKNKKM